jgi:hypothetical protein
LFSVQIQEWVAKLWIDLKPAVKLAKCDHEIRAVTPLVSQIRKDQELTPDLF